MEPKIKLIIIGLIGLLVVSIFVNFSILGGKQALVRDRDKLAQDNTALQDRFNKISKDYQSLEKKADSLSKEMKSIAAEKEELQAKYESVERIKQELVEQLKSAKSKPQPVMQEVVSGPAASDSYWAGVLKDKATLQVQIENIRSELRALQEKNDKLVREKSNLDVEVRNLNLEKQDLKRQLDYSKKQLVYNKNAMDSVSLELVGEKNDKLQINDSLKGLKEENLLLRQQLKVLNNRKVSLERKVQLLQDENNLFTKRFNEMDILLKDKIIQIDSMNKEITTGAGAAPVSSGMRKGPVELAPIIVRPQGSTGMLDEDSVGRVLAVNRENNFVIIDLGDVSGVKLGDTFKIVRDNNEIASAEVIQTRKTISACDIKKELTPIQVGDSVK